MMRKLMGTRMMGRMVLFLVMLLGCSGLSLAQNTADVQHGKHRKRMKERLAIADSLRLELRKAADEGRMFQWGDSLLRERLGKGQIDSARYMKLQARLQRADRHLHKGDQLLEAKYKKISFDTLYIGRPDARWTIKLRTNLSGAQLKFNGSKNQIPFNGDLRADYRGTLSVAVAYRGIAVGLAVNPAKLAGKSKDNEFNLNSYSNKFGFDVVLLSSKTYHGSVETNGVSSDINKGQLKQKAVNLNFYYAFNGRRFSFPAAFSQSYVQKRSAGSFMLGMSMDGQYTDAYDVMTNSGVGNAKMRIYALGIGAGYGYNLVVGRHWLFHLSTLPTFDVLLRSYIETDEGKVNLHYRFPSVIIVGRGAAVYSWKNKFFGATMVFNYSSVGDEDRLQIKRAKERLRLFYGFRF
ncbi:MAG: DUF4421 family protein [Prevotella sp.]|nr:DUF4421 family protein [Prevotella sp.]